MPPPRTTTHAARRVQSRTRPVPDVGAKAGGGIARTGNRSGGRERAVSAAISSICGLEVNTFSTLSHALSTSICPRVRKGCTHSYSYSTYPGRIECHPSWCRRYIATRSRCSSHACSPGTACTGRSSLPSSPAGTWESNETRVSFSASESSLLRPSSACLDLNGVRGPSLVSTERMHDELARREFHTAT